MNSIKRNLEEDIYRLRNELDSLLKTKSCLSLEVLKVSQKLDTLIVEDLVAHSCEFIHE